MNFEQYLNYFKEILDATEPAAPYDDPEYYEYTKLNWSRTNRWLKKGQLTPDAQQTIAAVDQVQEWVVITEPWCGDAAQCLPFIHLLAEANPKIKLRIELRDQEPFSIEQYLTNGSKSIPKLVIRDQNNQDLAVWGPRPEPAQALFEKLKAEEADFETQKEELQKWYNSDAGKAMQQEIIELLK